ncbi:acyltransferase family protein, partial [Streptococcus anginosus]|uniref:acyltransferase family protein n=1 Tax=Streptococcus anginosus TaxID=1328 RepID=UPI0034D2F59E|nr:acyltransferase [Streptococcus anginosus]
MRQERLYFPQLDTLRLFAMLAIICYHFFTNSLPGGFLAVDIFLILSGYLVTSQLERRLREGKPFRLGWQFFRRLGKMFWP